MRRSLLVAALLSTACLPDALTPDVGKQLEASCDDRDSEPDVPVSYKDDVVPIFTEYCAFCHTPGGRQPIGIEVGRLDLSSYSTLRAGGAISGTRIIVPGRPCDSLLIEKVSPFPSFGARMPLSGPPFVEDEEIQLLHDWIAEGARED